MRAIITLLSGNHIYKILGLIAIIILQLSITCLGIETKQIAISFDDVLEQAKVQSYDIKIADYDMFIAKQGIRTARSEYFPKLNASVGTEYTKNFKDYTNSIVSVVGDSFINPYTRFQSLMGITLTYNVFDFGVRKSKLDIAKEDVLLKELLTKEQHQELELTLIDTYCKLYITIQQIKKN